jgi:Tol biopolymer transport system component/tRNA A-37 threonylcarbamoyl transferase component Bud32
VPELLGRLQSALADRYRLEREVGAGGMATVYLAEDVRHDRRVALKVLRPELSAVIGAERFLAEIKLTANLQHPHILPLFDSGEADGYLFYVMPFVEGETLRDRLNREKQLPVPDALRITTEVASALDYAHRHGVVHRDIKPENILLHDGQALVADFGIALAASKASGARMTETGMSLGTPHYMSPEQAMGEREITPRSDVYALGAVLYEMLTGDPPFTGSTAQAIVARVVTEVPRPMLPQRHTIPRQVEAAVLTALEKLPADRFASAAEFAAALKDPSYATTTRVPVAEGPAAPVPRSTARRWQAVAVPVLTLLVGAAIGALLWPRLRPAPAPLLSQWSLAFKQAQALQPPDPSGGARIALSPDGRALAYIGPSESGRRLWLRRVDQLDATPIAGTEGASQPFFSPDGKRVGFVKNGTEVRIASLAGAPTITLYPKANTTSAAWGEDGYIYFEVDSGVARMRATGGEPEPVYKIDTKQKEIATEWVHILPGATGALFRLRHVGQGPADLEIMATHLPNGPAKHLVRGVFATYADGHLLVVTGDGKLIGIPFDPKKLEMTGAPVALLEGIGVRNNGFNIDFTIAQNGTLAYTTGGTQATRRAMWASREGGMTPIDPAWDPQGVIESAALSPDGKAIAVALTRDGRRDVWIKRLPTGPFSRLTFSDTSSGRPAWSADGKDVYYIVDRTGSGVGPVYARRSDGTGTPRLVTRADDIGQVTASRDGRWLVLRTAPAPPATPDILGLRVGDSVPVPLVATPATELFPALSPDGHWLAYSSDESGAAEIYVRPFPETAAAKWQVSTAGGTQPVWSSTGRELLYVNGKTEMVSAEIQPGTTFAVGAQRILFSAQQFAATGPVPGYSLSPDNKQFMALREGEAGQPGELVVAENWVQQLAGAGAK